MRRLRPRYCHVKSHDPRPHNSYEDSPVKKTKIHPTLEETDNTQISEQEITLSVSFPAFGFAVGLQNILHQTVIEARAARRSGATGAGYQLDSNSIRVGGTRNRSVPSYRPIHSVGSVASYIQARVRGRARTESSNFGRSGSERPITACGLRECTAQDGRSGRSHRKWPIRSSSSRDGPVMRRAHSCRSIINRSQIVSYRMPFGVEGCNRPPAPTCGPAPLAPSPSRVSFPTGPGTPDLQGCCAGTPQRLPKTPT
jgi:hypothetical protein